MAGRLSPLCCYWGRQQSRARPCVHAQLTHHQPVKRRDAPPTTADHFATRQVRRVHSAISPHDDPTTRLTARESTVRVVAPAGRQVMFARSPRRPFCPPRSTVSCELTMRDPGKKEVCPCPRLLCRARGVSRVDSWVWGSLDTNEQGAAATTARERIRRAASVFEFLGNDVGLKLETTGESL